MIAEHDIVVLTIPILDLGLQPGDIGTVVHVYENAKAYEVEFMDGLGVTIDVLTLEAANVRELETREILSARRLKSA